MPDTLAARRLMDLARDQGRGPWRAWQAQRPWRWAPLTVSATSAVGPVPLEAVAPMLMVTGRMSTVMRTRIGAVDRVLSMVQIPNGTVVIGGGYLGRADRDANATTLDYEKLAFNARIAATMFPALRAARIVRCWAGIEGHTPDGRPVIGPSASEEGAFHAFGFCSHGPHLGPAIGRILAELVTRGRSNLPIEPFRVDRFAQRG